MKPYSVVEYSQFRRNGHVYALHPFGPRRRHLTGHDRRMTLPYLLALSVVGLVAWAILIGGTIVILRFIRFLLGAS